MRVAVVLPELDPHQGGGFTFQQTLYAELRRVEASSPHTFVYYTPGTHRERDMRPLRFTHRAIIARALHQAVRRLEDDILGLPRLLSRRTAFERSLARDGAELVWFTTPWADDCDLPYLITVWDLEYLRQPWFPEVSVWGEWERRERHYRRYLPKASGVIAPNAVGVEQVHQWFGVPRERILDLPHPTPQLAEPESTLPPRQRPYLLYPAQLWAHKDHAALFRALRELRDRGLEYDLVLVGSDKGAGDHLRRLTVELGLADRVEFRGFVPASELTALYRGAHALTFPSRFGPENLPPLEAFTQACPVVVADVPGICQQLGESALYVAPGDASAIADAVVRLQDDRLRESLVREGAARAAAASAERYVQTVLEWIDRFEPTVRTWRSER